MFTQPNYYSSVMGKIETLLNVQRFILFTTYACTNTHYLKRNFIKENVIYKKENNMRFFFLMLPLRTYKKERKKMIKKNQRMQWMVTFKTFFLKWQGLILTGFLLPSL